MDSLTVPRKLWEHPNPESTDMYRFMQEVNNKHGLQIKVPYLVSVKVSTAKYICRHSGSYISTQSPNVRDSGTNVSTSSTSFTAARTPVSWMKTPEWTRYPVGSRVYI